jgi:hypothetical protein
MAIVLVCLYVIIYFMGLRMYRKTGRKWYRITYNGQHLTGQSHY